MDAFGAVHHLRHVVVDRHAGDHVGLFPRDIRIALGDEVDGLAHRDLHRLVQVGIEPHHDPMGRRLRPRPCELHVLVQDKLKLAAQAGLDRGEVDLAVALRRVRVAHGEQRAGGEHRHEQGRARDQVLVVQVAGVNAGRAAADAAHGRVGRQAHGAEERLVDRHHDALGDRGGLRLAVDRDDAAPERGELFRQRPVIGTLAVVAVVERKIDVDDAHFEHVARHRAADLDRPGEDVRTGAAILHLRVDVALILRDDAGRDHAGFVDRRRQDREGGLDGDGVAGIDAQHRLHARHEVADVDGLWVGHQGVFGGPCRNAKRDDERQRSGAGRQKT